MKTSGLTREAVFGQQPGAWQQLQAVNLLLKKHKMLQQEINNHELRVNLSSSGERKQDGQ